MALKKKISAKQAARMNPQPEKQAVSAQQTDIDKIIKATVEEVISKSASDTAALVKAIENIKPNAPEVQLVQNSAPPIKTIKVTNIARDGKGFIKDMDMKVERESLH